MARIVNKQLPTEVFQPTNRNSIATQIFGTLALVIVFNFVALWYLTYFTSNTGYLLIRGKWHLLQNLPEKLDLLILGDSSGNQGADPEVLTDKSGISSANFCVIGDAMVLNDAWMLDKYIELKGPPEAVLIIHGYDIWSRNINISVLAQIPGDWWNRQPELNIGPKDRIRIFLNRYLPLYAETRTLSHMIQHPGTLFEVGLDLRHDGFMIESDARPENVEKDLKAHLGFLANRREVLSAPNRKALDYIAGLAEKHKFYIFIANGPVYTGLFEDSTFQNYYSDLRLVIEAMANSNSRLHYLLDPPMTFEKEHLQSVDHVTLTGAQKYTAQLASEIDNILGGTK